MVKCYVGLAPSLTDRFFMFVIAAMITRMLRVKSSRRTVQSYSSLTIAAKSEHPSERRVSVQCNEQTLRLSYDRMPLYTRATRSQIDQQQLSIDTGEWRRLNLMSTGTTYSQDM